MLFWREITFVSYSLTSYIFGLDNNNNLIITQCLKIVYCLLNCFEIIF